MLGITDARDLGGDDRERNMGPGRLRGFHHRIGRAIYGVNGNDVARRDDQRAGLVGEATTPSTLRSSAMSVAAASGDTVI